MTPESPVCPVSWVKRVTKVNQPEKVPPDLKDLKVCPDFLGKKASPATPAYQDHPAYQGFQDKRAKPAFPACPVSLVSTERQEHLESPDVTAQSAFREYKVKRVTKEVLASLEFLASAVPMGYPVWPAKKATPATPVFQAPSVPQERLDLKENLDYPECLDKRVYLATYPRRATEATRVFREPLAQLVPLEHLVMTELLA